MNNFVLFIIAIRAIWRNKVRSVLTMLGVIIGVMAVILLLAIGSGLQNYITQEFEAMGTNTLVIMPGEEDESGGFGGAAMAASMTNTRLRFEDVVKIQRIREYVTSVIPEYVSAANIEYKDKTKKNVAVYATTSDLIHMDIVTLGSGEFFSKIDVDNSQRVVVLGSKIATDLFGSVNPIGRRVQISGSPYMVKGVLAKGKGLIGSQMDNYMILPITSAHQLFDSKIISQINIQVKNKDVVEVAKEQIKNTLLTRLKEDDFHFVDQESMLASINNILSILSAGLAGIAAISLLVGGIGIMNIMLVSVTERTREIGLRKALGATPAVIMIQFLIESSVLSVMGGMIGVLISFGITLIMQQFFPAAITWWSVTLAFVVSAFTGIVFGVLPARKAARLSPIEALRYE